MVKLRLTLHITFKCSLYKGVVVASFEITFYNIDKSMF